jgi:hypothetical protein
MKWSRPEGRRGAAERLQQQWCWPSSLVPRCLSGAFSCKNGPADSLAPDAQRYCPRRLLSLKLAPRHLGRRSSSPAWNACPCDQCGVRSKVPIGGWPCKVECGSGQPTRTGSFGCISAQRRHDRGGSKSSNSLTATRASVQSPSPTPLRNQQQRCRLAAHSRCGRTIGN